MIAPFCLDELFLAGRPIGAILAFAVLVDPVRPTSPGSWHSQWETPPLVFTMPEAPGLYEFRLLDLAGPKVLSRAMIEVR